MQSKGRHNFFSIFKASLGSKILAETKQKMEHQKYILAPGHPYCQIQIYLSKRVW